ncbi:unnamed protein product [Adineta ricciae]|uniref:Uncharacterized protein n=1 Tax=Adineta ricciae TaxID=249248 RepID=A0A815EN96_ADIRI|nr:unnamed protein product [Adineta ricciae]CAF1507449.1 unnamed protein product [Adineta ricciae]
MEHRLVLNNRSESDIPDRVLCGQLQQQLKYYKFRRVHAKDGKDIYYLFFKREEETYYALQAGKSIKNISLVRYRHRNMTAAPVCRPDEILPNEAQYQPVPSRRTVDIIRYNFSRYIDRFSNKDVFKLCIKRLSEQVVVQRMNMYEIQTRNCKVNHWWWLNPQYTVNNHQNIQKIMDIFFT